MAENLIVYQASAGSGKTFMLTREYLLLLFKSPRAFQRILAVTFTNKASAEMKSRILKELHILALGKKSDHLDIIRQECTLDEAAIQKTAGETLFRILHNFTRFQVGTIDKFFQRVIRSFAREIGITPSFTIELDTSEILQRAVDEVFYLIDEKEDLRKWLVSFAIEKVEKGSDWQIDNDIIQLGKEIFKEEFKTFESHLLQCLNDGKNIEDYKNTLQEVIRNYTHKAEQLANQAASFFEKEGLSVDDFSYKKSGAFGNLLKICAHGETTVNVRLHSAIANADGWVKKGSKLQQQVNECLEAGAQNTLELLLRHYNQQYKAYLTAVNITENLPALGVIGEIHHALYQVVREQNLFLLSDAGIFLNNIIGNNDAPFVYEKTGNTYSHFMIDEFQDTSQLQWNSFRPLILNSLASGMRNVIVGDVKQSIYRWRNSDYTILASGIETEFAQFSPEFRPLQNNFRSAKNVIAFNNSFFQGAHKMLAASIVTSDNAEAKAGAERITAAYKNLYQSPGISQSAAGQVSISFPDEAYDDLTEIAINDLIQNIEELQQRGVAPGEIIVLVRKATEGSLVLNELLNYKNTPEARLDVSYNAISGESLKLESAPAIRFVLYFFSYLSFPDDALNNARLIHEYLHHLRVSDKKYIHQPFGENETDFSDPDKVALQLGLNEFPGGWKRLSLLELLEKITGWFGIGEDSAVIPYLQAFKDVILEYTIKYASGTNAFLEWWESTGYKKAVPESESSDALRIMTIHKAKGLQAKAILIPFCNWDVDHQPQLTNLLWCRPENEPFNSFPLVPVKYSKTLADTDFSTSWAMERANAFLDNLNLLYVAFTRAEKYLRVYCPVKPGKEIKTIADVIYRSLQIDPAEDKTEKFPFLALSSYMEGTTFKIGELEDGPGPHSRPADQSSVGFRYQTHDYNNRLSFRSGRFSDILDENPEELNILDTGTLYHKIFEHIKSEDDAALAVDKLVFEGLIPLREKETYIKKTNTYLKQAKAYEWFTGKYPVRSEAAILTNSGTLIRPDRVILTPEKNIVIDFKFGHHIEEKHKMQVYNYMSKIKKIDNKPVEGYLWYPELKKIISINEKSGIQKSLF